MNERMTWPEGKDFAFTIFDDTDWAALDNVREVYALLSDYGFRTTKSVWPIRGSGKPRNAGSTCDDQDYLAWLRGLQDEGFEIGLHNVAFHSSVRQETIRGFQRFEELFGPTRLGYLVKRIDEVPGRVSDEQARRLKD